MSKAQKKFQIDIQSPYEILPHLEYPGLVILEVYQRWAGPSPAVEGVFRGYYTTFLNAKIKFLRSPSDILPWTRRFHGRCRPVFILILGGVVKKVFIGVDLPLMDHEIPLIVPTEDVEVKKFIPEAQFLELQNDKQFNDSWQEAMQQRSAAIDAAQIAKDNGVDPDVDPNEVFDNIVLKNQSNWTKLDEFSTVSAQKQFSLPSASCYEKTVESQDEKLAEFVGQLEEVKNNDVIISDKPEEIISRLLPKFQQFYENQPEKIELNNIFNEMQQLDIPASQNLIEKMASLADVQNEGKIDKLDACLIATTLEFRPRLQEMRSGNARFIEQAGEVEKIDTLKVNKSESDIQRVQSATNERPEPFEKSDGKSFRADESVHENSIHEEQQSRGVIPSQPSPFENSDNKSMRYGEDQQQEVKQQEQEQEKIMTLEEPIIPEEQPQATAVEEPTVEPVAATEEVNPLQALIEPEKPVEQAPPSPINPDGSRPSQFNDSVNSVIEYK